MIRHRRIILVLVASLALLVLAGCQFPGAGVSVSFTSPTPAEGTRITGVSSHPYSLTVAVKVAGAVPDSFKLTDNGVQVPSSAITVSGDTYTASVQLADGANALVATATAAGFTYTATRHVYFPFLALGNGQAANVAIGQLNMTSSAPGTTQYQMDLPAGAPALVADKLYFPDTANNRLVGYKNVPSSNGSLFSILIGQSDYFAGDPKSTVTGYTITGATGVADNDGSLVVADAGDNRVLLFNGAPTLTTASASVEVGQPGMSTRTATGCDPRTLSAPGSAVVAGGKLIVADTNHNRVMIWNSIPTTSGVQANVVLGQSGFTACDPNRSTGTATPTDSTLDHPSSVWSDGTHLIVADTGNNRVLVWNSFPTSNGQAATRVIGQASMSTDTVNSADDPAGTVKTGLDAPRGVDSNGNQIFIADTGYNRVVVFDAFPTSNGAHADRVLGQSSLSSGTSPNRGSSPAANTLSGPQGVRAFDGYLIVADTQNSRELLYRPPSP